MRKTFAAAVFCLLTAPFLLIESKGAVREIVLQEKDRQNLVFDSGDLKGRWNLYHDLHRMAFYVVAEGATLKRGDFLSGKLELFRTVLEHEIDNIRCGLNAVKAKYDVISGQELEEYFMVRIRLITAAKVYRQYVLSSYMLGRNEVSEAVDEVRKKLDDDEYAFFLEVCRTGKEKNIFPEAVSPEIFGNMMLLVLKGIEIQLFDTDDIAKMEETYKAMLEVLMFKIYKNN